MSEEAMSTGEASADAGADAGGFTREDLLSGSKFIQEHQESGTDKESDGMQRFLERMDKELSDNPEPDATVNDSEDEASTESETEEPAASSDSSETEEAQATPTEITLSDGTKVTLEQIEKERMLNADYTRKTQALAEERRLMQERILDELGGQETIGQMKSIYEGLKRDPIGMIESLREHFEQQGHFEPKDSATLEIEDAKRALEQERKAFDQQKAADEQQRRLSDFQKYIGDLESKHKADGWDTDKVLQYCAEKNIPDPEVGFKAMTRDDTIGNLKKQVDELTKKQKEQVEKEVEARLASYITSKTSKTGAPLPVGASGTTGTPPVTLDRPTTFKGAMGSLISKLGNT